MHGLRGCVAICRRCVTLRIGAVGARLRGHDVGDWGKESRTLSLGIAGLGLLCFFPLRLNSKLDVMPAQAGTHDTSRWNDPMPIGMPTRFAKEPSVYILASKRDGILYVGVTSEPWDRVNAHKQGLIDGFTKKYDVSMLVYIEFHEDMNGAIRREKQLKKWNRAWKVRLIQEVNPEWHDLWLPSGEILMQGPAGRVSRRDDASR